MKLAPAFEAAAFLKTEGIGSKIVSIINPRRLYRPSDVAWEPVANQTAHLRC